MDQEKFISEKNIELEDQFIHNAAAHSWFVLAEAFKALQKFKNEKLVGPLNGHLKDLDIKKLSAIMLINSVMIQNTYDECIGLSFDPFLSLINHSCDPNVTFIFEDKTIKIIALRGIKKGQELFVSYVLTSLPTTIRKFELEGRFFFKCHCKLFQKTSDRYLTFNCPNCGMMLDNNILSEKTPKKLHCVGCSHNCLGSYINNWKLYADIFNKYWGIVCDNLADQCSNYRETVYMKETYHKKRKLKFQEVLKDKNCYTDLFPHQFLNIEFEEMRELTMLLSNAFAEQMIPMYMFPIPQILEDIVSNFKDHDLSKEHIQWLLISTFKSRIPCDLYTFKPTVGNDFRELAIELFESSQQLNGSFSSNEIPVLNHESIIKLKCGLWFGLNAEMHLSKVYSTQSPVLREVQLLNLEILRFMSCSKSPVLQSWVKHLGSAKMLDDGELPQVIGGVSKRLKIQFANRGYEKVLVDMDDLEERQLEWYRKSL
ncbi:hypothetical protein DASC09_049600 [Saccharomycopsis crataegensis]|uniref:SET domain-containing protein n=1 Tax=Saccharomycopsis crataegensis TaxID=43959 RepID=A0AAV5QSR6_9ASCO|nr:hypothetical protein DASC09_049600 [Saccharomycopsis crataegensis]